MLDNRSESNMHILRDLGLNRNSLLTDVITNVNLKVTQLARDKPQRVALKHTSPLANSTVKQYARQFTDPVLEAISANLSMFPEYKWARIPPDDPAASRPCECGMFRGPNSTAVVMTCVRHKDELPAEGSAHVPVTRIVWADMTNAAAPAFHCSCHFLQRYGVPCAHMLIVAPSHDYGMFMPHLM